MTGTLDRPGQPGDQPDRPDRPDDRVDRPPAGGLVVAGRRLPPVAFPVLAFICWRLVHAVVVVASGGSLAGTALTFDAAYYRDIIDHGYALTDPTYQDFQTLAFFPGFPLVALPLVKLLGVSVGGSLIVNALGLGAFITVWGAARSWYGERVARLAVVTLACWPGSLFLWAFYSEGLFVAASAGAVWADRSGRTRLAAVLVVVAGLTRSPGLALGPVLFALRWWERRRVDAVGVLYLGCSAVSAAVLAVVGAVAAEDPLAFVHAQRAWGRSSALPWMPMVDAVRHIVDSLPRPAEETSMNLAAVAVFAGIGLWGLLRAVRAGGRDPWFPPVWTLVATALPVISLVSSMVRLVLSAWTGFVLLALALQDRRVLRWAVWVVTTAVSVLLIRRLAHGAFVA